MGLIPKELEAKRQQRIAERDASRKTLLDQHRKMESELQINVNTFNLVFVHVRGELAYEAGDDEETVEYAPKGGLTIAYTEPAREGNIIEISLTLCNTKENFDRFLGRYYAAEEFAQGRRIKVRLPESGNIAEQLKQHFEFMV